MIELALIGSALGSAALAAATTAWVTRAPRLRAEKRLSELESELSRERSSARRKLSELGLVHAQTTSRLRSALGLPPNAAELEPMSARRLPQALRERLEGLIEVDAVVVADATGLAWTREESRLDHALAAASAAVLASRLAGQAPRAVHVELADARHLVICPLPGTEPAMALAVASTSRPASAFAIDAALAYVVEARKHTLVDPTEPDPLVGHALAQARAGSALGPQLLAELERESSHAGVGMLAIGVGEDVVAAHGSDGPSAADLSALHLELRALMDRIAHRMGGRVRRLDWSSLGASTASAVSVGPTGRSLLIGASRAGKLDVGSFDRLAGRLRRLLPNEGSRGAQPRDEARHA